MKEGEGRRREENEGGRGRVKEGEGRRREENEEGRESHVNTHSYYCTEKQVLLYAHISSSCSGYGDLFGYNLH